MESYGQVSLDYNLTFYCLNKWSGQVSNITMSEHREHLFSESRPELQSRPITDYYKWNISGNLHKSTSKYY